MLEERIDVGFILPRLADESLIVETVVQEPLVLALSEAHPLAVHNEVQVQQLRNERFIMGFPGDRCGLYAAVMSICHQAGFIPRV